MSDSFFYCNSGFFYVKMYMAIQIERQEHRMKGKGIHSRSIFVQLVVFSLLASLVPILIISIFLFYKLDSTAQAETKDYHEQITSQYMKNIEEKLQQYRNSLEVIANNTVILKTLTDETMNPYDRGEVVSQEVDNSLLLEMQSEVRNCMVYSRVQNCKVHQVIWWWIPDCVYIAIRVGHRM